MSGTTRVFLVLLQLVIGWHFFYEGLWKLREASWTSRGYLRNATGPAALWARYLSGDPEVRREGGNLVATDPAVDVVERFTAPPAGDSLDPARLPPSVAKEWDDYFAAFAKHYKLEEPDDAVFRAVAPAALFGAGFQSQFLSGVPWGAMAVAGAREPGNPLQPSVRRMAAEYNYAAAKGNLAYWLAEGTKMVRRPHLSGPKAEVPVTTPERVREYAAKVREVRDLEANQMNVFGSKVSDRYRKAVAEESSLRAGLLADLNEQTGAMKYWTRQALTYEQRRLAPPPEPKPEAPREWTWLPWIDRTVTWGLLLVGAGLMLGLFTRLSCLGGVALLALFYITWPALPGLPDNPMSEGHYLLINKNIIEMVALLAIAAAHTGRWYGLDAWLDPLKPWKWRRSEERFSRELPPRTARADALAPRK